MGYLTPGRLVLFLFISQTVGRYRYLSRAAAIRKAPCTFSQ